jgi:hypothetical protein
MSKVEGRKSKEQKNKQMKKGRPVVNRTAALFWFVVGCLIDDIELVILNWYY